MSDTDVKKVVIIGSGPAGWTAAIYAARAGLEPVVYVGVPKQDPGPVLPGGQLMLTTDVENYPGFPEGVSGPEMMGMFQRQAERFGAQIVGEDIEQCEFHPEGSFHTLHTSGGQSVKAHSVIIATGATANWLGLESEMRLATSGGGVSACAVCDGALPMFRDQPLAVVGGGDTAMEEAHHLTKFASTVYVIHRRDELRASKTMQDRVLSKDNVEMVWNADVEECLSEKDQFGSDKLTGVRLRDTQTGEERVLEVKGLFIAGRTSRACTAPGTWPTRPTARRSRRRGWGARRPWTPSMTWANAGCSEPLDQRIRKGRSAECSAPLSLVLAFGRAISPRP